MFYTYARFIVRHSYLFLFIVSIIFTTLTVVPLICHHLPSFSDPIVGFETRGTTLAHRFIAWENLIDETRPSRRLAANPKDIEDQIRMNQTYHSKIKTNKGKSGEKRSKKYKSKKKYNNTGLVVTLYNSTATNESNGHVHWGFGKNVTHEDEDAIFRKDYDRKQWKTLKNMQRTPDLVRSHNYASGTCGPPLFNYAHLVVTSTDGTSMLTFENVKKMCQLQSHLIELSEYDYYNLCEKSIKEDLCCPMWSLPNYIALVGGKNSCENITSEDVYSVLQILEKCAGYFYNFTLMSSCELGRCAVPRYCAQYDAVYNLLFYIIDSDAFSMPNYSNVFVKSVMVFLPLPCSSTVLPYYMKLQSSKLSYDTLFIPGIDFCLKNTLFDKWVVEDAWLIGVGGLFVFLCVFAYTKSLILTVLLFTAISYSIGVAYFLYVYVFFLEFFPFMNLLVIVVVIGIGADDAFLYVKVWNMVSTQLIKDNTENEDNVMTEATNISSAGETILVQIIEETLRHSIIAIFITTLTTAIAFYASFVSYIPAINCFSLFAGTAVSVNFILMISWLPVSVFILDVRMCKRNWVRLGSIIRNINEICVNVKVILNRFIVTCIVRLHLVIVLILSAIGIGSIVVVFVYPGLQLPDTKEFQLFQSDHPFEKYEMEYREKFLFEKFSKDIGTGSNMPLRWIWGVKAIDNGNHMDPFSKGKLIFDEDFNMSRPSSQLWLMDFCRKIKLQTFYQRTLGPLLPNCFIESFKMFMSRRCLDKIDKIDRTPCCETSHFPYTQEVFDYCILKAIESLYRTPRQIFMPGVAGPKFLRSVHPPTISAVVVEFESVVPYSLSYTAMNNFFTQVENWTIQELKLAPPGMKNGWFLSDFQFYDLQKTLANSTIITLLLSAFLGFIVLLPFTKSFTLNICALLAIIFSSTVTIAILVLSGWKLNVLESVAISTSAGLAVDFSLHYVLSYKNASGNKSTRVKYALSASSGPTAAAALTTGVAGIFLLWSNLLPYSQIGTFLALIMAVSWIYATFFLCSLLHIVGFGTAKEPQVEEQKSVSRVSSVCSGVPNLESHELEHLADSNRTNITHSHSPSSFSAMTVIIHDDFENSLNKIEKSHSIVLDND